MRKFLLTQLAMLAIMATTFVAGGYAMPYYFNDETIVTADKVKFVRGNGFYSKLTYEKNLRSGQEKVKILGAFPYRSERVIYDAICKCITDASRDDGTKKYSFSVHTDDGIVFFVDQNVQSESHGTIWLGWWMDTDKAEPEIAQAKSTLDTARRRFAGDLPKE